MKRLILFIGLILLSVIGFSQTPLKALSGIKIGRLVSGTGIITIDSITQFSTGDFRLWKGGVQLSPNLKTGFKIGSDAVPSTLTATELGYSDGVTSAIQSQLNAKPDTSDVVNIADSIWGYEGDEIDVIKGIKRLQFIANVTADAPVTDDTIMYLTDFLTKHVKLIRAGAVQYFNTTATNGKLGFRQDKTVGFIVVRPSFAASELVQIELSNEPNWTYPTLPVLQNLILQSEDLATTWTNGGSVFTITADQSADLTGATTLDLVTKAGTGSLSQNFNVTAGQTYRISFDARRGNTLTIEVQIDKNSNGAMVAQGYFSTLNPAFNVTTPVRISIDVTVPAGETAMGLKIVSQDSNNGTVYVGRVQVQNLSVNGPYVKTTTAVNP